ncbi:MAG: hypothetical protein ABL921_32355 [Pirellula sp.]
MEQQHERFEKLRERTVTEAQNLREAIRGIKERQRSEPRENDAKLLKALQRELKELELTIEAMDIQESMYGN